MTAPDPFAHGGREHPDAALLAAEQEFRELEARFAARADNANANEDTEINPVFTRWMAVMDMIEATPPATIEGCAVKLRVLMHEQVGLPAGESPKDMICLRQVRDFLNAASRSHPTTGAALASGGVIAEAGSGEIAALFDQWLALRGSESRADDEQVDALGDEMSRVATAILAVCASEGVPYVTVEALEALYRQFVIARVADPTLRARELRCSGVRVNHAKEHIAEREDWP
jgi:hypothetical protein